MGTSRVRTLRKVLTHLKGWRAWVLASSLVPLVAVLLVGADDRWIGVLIGVAAGIPALVVALVLTVDTTTSADLLVRIIGPARRIDTNVESLHRRVEVLDLVVSSETRRPWEPTTLPFQFVSGRDPKPILLLPGADYHLPEIVAIADELDSRGIPNVIAVGRPHWERTGDGLIWYDRQIFSAPAAEDIPDSFSALVTMKDWAGYGPLVVAAKESGIPTFAKVEGAQDFHDVDTNKPRRPYRTARHILCQGHHDHDALEHMTRTIVGSTRLERLWWAPPAIPSKPLALINLNFTYGVLTEVRDLWLRTAIEGCELAGVPYVVSVHPAERARNPHPKATSVSASQLLRHATFLISRFSTLPLEAMARGVPFIYHNPHGELVQLFSEPKGAFDVSTSGEELGRALARTPGVDSQRKTVFNFFEHVISIDPTITSGRRTVEAILASSLKVDFD